MAEVAYGFDMTVDDGASNAHAALPDILDITPPASEVAAVGFLPLNASSNVKQYIPGSIDPKQVKVKQVYDATEYSRMAGLKGEDHEWIVYPSGNATGKQTGTFDGFVVNVELDQQSDADGIKSFTTTVQMTSDITLGTKS